MDTSVNNTTKIPGLWSSHSTRGRKTINIRNKKQSDGSKIISTNGKIRKEEDRGCKAI